ncbi:MAG: hypothetical protein HY649_12380 [Acidobacteria bacterium]|nr:hypothetical protein [Acidobacteriota bacterium]
MPARGFWRRKSWISVWICLVLASATWVLFSNEASRSELAAASRAAMRRPTGFPQLIRVEPLPDIAGQMCEWVPASSQQLLVASVLQQRMAARSGAAEADAAPSVVVEREPLRVIRDPFPTYSAVAVDLVNNEIVLQDENLFQIMVYDREASTPPTATMTEPKRIIGGPDSKNTHMEFNCGLYVDPQTGDIYSVNNDTIDTLTIFSRSARGDVAPDRQLHTPHRTYGIAVDEAAQELFLSVQTPALVAVYPKYAKDDDPPVRALRGNRTQLEDPHGIALDTKNGWLFVANYGNATDYLDGGGNSLAPNDDESLTPGSGRYEPPSITVYPIKASGDTPPIRIIEGPKTRLNWPAHIFVDEQRGDLYVANDVDDSILVFRTADQGDVAPQRVIKGPKTGIKNPTGVFVDTVNKELVVSNMGNHSATVYPLTAAGDVAPIRTIRGGPEGKPALQIGNPGAVAYDTKRNEILVPN